MQLSDVNAVRTDGGINWWTTIPFAMVHLLALGVFWVGISPVAVGVCLALFWLRMFAITGFYHRYLSHRSYKTSRWFQFLFALLGNSSVQKGPLWWAGHHRHHHKYSDQDEDVHSPIKRGFLYSHVGWIFARANSPTRIALVPDLAKFPELRAIDRFDILMPILLGTSCFGLGVLLQTYVPSLGTSGPQMLFWGFFLSTVILVNATFTINSLSHIFGKRRFETGDTSRNNWLLALLTLGEGWHNNHHYYATATRQGFYWWEIDITYYGLVLLSKLGLIWDLKRVPERILDEGRVLNRAEAAAA
ncbi:MAG: acyl-CoA desaturase [Acidobacteriota bacterium]|nr:MAG: acyl-CoA desaturase [Acidobacteriota bacterium]